MALTIRKVSDEGSLDDAEAPAGGGVGWGVGRRVGCDLYPEGQGNSVTVHPLPDTVPPGFIPRL